MSSLGSRTHLRPSLSSRVNDSPTIPASEPRREMMSPVERMPVSLTGTTAVELEVAVAEVD